MKRCSISLIIREMQIKSTVKCHFTLVRMATIKKRTCNKYWRENGKKRTLLHCQWESKLVQQVWKTVWRFLKKRKRDLPLDPTILLLSINPAKMKVLILNDVGTPIFIVPLLIIVKMWKQPGQPSTEEWINKRWPMYTMDYYSAIKSNEIVLFGSQMDLEIIN